MQKPTAAALLVVAVLIAASAVSAQRCVKRPAHPVPTLVKSPMPHTYIAAPTIPKYWNWCNMSGVNYCSMSRNQHIPTYCGSCWAMASTSTLADRIRIARNARYPDYEVAVQTIVYCVCTGCDGGMAELAYNYIANNGVGEGTCQNYIAQGSGTECSAIHRCENCKGFHSNCTAVPEGQYPMFGISEHGTVLGEEEMMAEIYARGPIACYVNAGPIWDWGFGPNGTGIFNNCSATADPTCGTIDHVISVVGFGEDNGQKWWLIRNSWGAYYGVRGYFRLGRGTDQIGIETTPCAWAIPTLPPEPPMP